MPEKAEPAAEAKPHVSPSSMGTFALCGVMYQKKYIDKIPRAVGTALIIGGATHSSVQRDLRHMIDTGLLLKDAEIQDIARDAFAVKWNTSGDILLSEDEKAIGEQAVRGAGTDLSVALAMLHHYEIAPNLFPSHVEHKFRLVIKGYPYDILGILDVREEGAESKLFSHYVTVRDTKTAGKTPSQQDVDRTEQLTVYAMWERQSSGKAPGAVFIDALVKTKVPKAVSLKSTRNDYDFQTFLLRMERFCEALEKGAFVPCDPTDWICTPKWCGYYDTCPFGRRKRVQV